MKCGSCKENHETVSQVRDCYSRKVAAPAEPAAQQGIPGVEDWARERQAVQTETGSPFFLEPERNILEDKKARTKSLADSLPDLHRARYAVEIDGALKFYQVDKPTEGKWAGYTFIKVQASDETYPVKGLGARIKVLTAILKDQQAAMLRYGREIGSCGHCGRTLTNEESRAYGIGPVCRGKMGW